MRKNELIALIDNCGLSEESLIQIQDKLNLYEDGSEIPNDMLLLVIDIMRLENDLDDITISAIDDMIKKISDTENAVNSVVQSTEQLLDQNLQEIEKIGNEVEADMKFVEDSIAQND